MRIFGPLISAGTRCRPWPCSRNSHVRVGGVSAPAAALCCAHGASRSSGSVPPVVPKVGSWRSASPAQVAARQRVRAGDPHELVSFRFRPPQTQARRPPIVSEHRAIPADVARRHSRVPSSVPVRGGGGGGGRGRQACLYSHLGAVTYGAPLGLISLIGGTD